MRREWKFEGSHDGFTYADDTFRFTSSPAYASGGLAPGVGTGGSGALEVRLGGVDDRSVAGMSGGWSTSLNLEEATDVKLTFKVRMTQSPNYEANEYSEVLLALNGRLLGPSGRDYVARIHGDGDGGPSRSTGWITVTVDLGRMEAGKHELTFGGHNNLKNARNEFTTLHFDDIVIEGRPVAGGTGSGGTGSGGTGSGGTGSGGTGSGGTLPPPVASDGFGAFEARVLELTNQFRVTNGRTPFENDAKLNAAAEGWSKSMAYGDFFRHSTPAQVEAEGYAWRAWGENIAAGQRTPEQVVNAWINSPGHRANMLNANFKEMGVGYYHLENDTGRVNYNHYWTQTFGTEADALI